MTEIANVTDWQAYLRDCIREPGGHPELPADLNVDAALSKVGYDMKGTPRGVAFADAALAIIEHGDPDEVKQLLQISLVEAPRAADRIAALVGKWRGTALADMTVNLLLGAIEAEPRNAHVLAAFEAEAKIEEPGKEYRELRTRDKTTDIDDALVNEIRAWTGKPASASAAPARHHANARYAILRRRAKRLLRRNRARH